MKTLPRLILVAILGLAWIGCDSNEATDSEKFVGTWTLVKVEDATGDITASWAAGVQLFQATLRGDNTSTLVVDFTAAAELGGSVDINDSGSYSVNETTKIVTLSHLGAQLPLAYNFIDDDTNELSASATLINAVFGSSYTGTVTITVTK